MNEGHIFIDGIITNDYHLEVKRQIAALGNVDTLVVHIQSPGGSVYAGYNTYNVLKSSGKKIKAIIEGEAQSMATFISLAADKGMIEIKRPSTYMIHNPSQGLEGDADALSNGVEELRKIEEEMAEAYSRKTKLPIDQIKAMMKKETRMNAEEAVKYGFADTIHDQLRAVAIGKNDVIMENTEEVKGLIQKIGDGINALLGKSTTEAATVTAPSAVDLALKDGKMLMVAGEDGDIVGKPATVDGAPAPDGAHELADGRTVVIAGGLVTEVKEAMTPEQKQLQDLQAKLAASEQEKATLAAQVEQTKVAAEQATEQLTTTASALGEIKKEVETLKKKTVGDDNPPNKGMNAFPTASGKSSDESLKIAATRTHLADNMPWLERHYAGGKFSDGTRFMDYRTGGPNAVSILETNLNYTWNGVLSTELFFKPTLSSPALADIFTIDLGASDKKRYHIAPVFNKVLKPYTGCDQAVTGSSFDITSKYIQLKPFEMYEGWCKDDFTNQLTGSYNVLAQEWLKTGTASFDPAGTPIDRIIVDGLKDALRRDIFRRVSFGDTTTSNADYNQIDGLWQSLIDQSGASNYCVYRYGSALGTGTLSAGTAQTYLAGIFNNSSNLLKEQAIDGGKGKFLVTRSVWENLYDSYAATGAVTEQAFKNQTNGLPNLTFRGIPVVPVTIWDDQLADSNNPLSSTTRHLIAFTIKDNHILGVENNADLDKIDSWFEKKDNKRYYRANMTMGFLGAIHCELTTISY